MKTRIDWVRENCLLLNAIGEEFGVTQPFAGRTIGTGIHLEPKTVALLMTLQKGGARVVSTGNLNTTQLLAVERLRDEGVTVIGGPTTDLAEHKRNLEAVLDHRPDMLLDNGGDLFDLWRQRRHAGLLGGTEETTSGRMRLAPLRAQNWPSRSSSSTTARSSNSPRMNMRSARACLNPTSGSPTA